MHVLIDSDIICWMGSAGTEYMTYKSPSLGTFRHKRDLTDLLKFNYEAEEYDPALEEVERIIYREPLSTTYKAIDGIVERIVRDIDATRYTLVVKGEKPNFRKDIPYPVVYKGNRTGERPTNFDSCYNYICTLPGVVYAEGMEVDDMLGIMQDKLTDTTCIASTDKDLLQIPGLHYNINHREVRRVSEEEGDTWFWRQMLIGDPVDNIIGVDKIGPKKAEKFITLGMSWDEMSHVVKQKYIDCFKHKWKEMYEANLRLLWILREHPE